MARRGNPISIRLNHNRSSDSSWFSDYYYGKLVYQDINLRSYFASIRPPTRLTFGFRLGRSIIQHFPKRTFIHFFIPLCSCGISRPCYKHNRQGEKKGEKSRREKEKKIAKKLDQWWEFRKVGPIYSLSESSYSRGGKEVETSHQLKGKLSAVHPSSRFSRASLISSQSCRAFLLRAQYPSLNYLVIQYLLKRKNQMHFDPVRVLNHSAGVLEPLERAEVLEPVNEEAIIVGDSSEDRRLRSRIAFFVQSSLIGKTGRENPSLAKKGLTRFISLANDLRFAGSRKRTVLLFPFFGAAFFLAFSRSYPGLSNFSSFLSRSKKGLGGHFKSRKGSLSVSNNLRERVLGKLRIKCGNLIAQDRVKKWIEKFMNKGGINELKKGIEIMVEIILKNRRIPYGYNSYLNEVKNMRSFLSKRTKTNTLIFSRKNQSLYQSASLIAQDISFQPKRKRRSFLKILSQIVRNMPLLMKKGVEGIRISCSGRLEGAEIARTECAKFGKTSCNVLDQKIDYASAEVATRYGILGLKVWISYSLKGRATSET